MNKVITQMNTLGVRDEETGCLRWSGAKNSHGYGQGRGPDGVLEGIHRISYRTFVGEIPKGYDIDHVYARGCRHVDCYEPTHLEAVTHAENMRRVYERMTHCKYGHEYTPANTYSCDNGRGFMGRKCRTCRSAKDKKRNRSQRYQKRAPLSETTTK
jgi:hypothetical protein